MNKRNILTALCLLASSSAIPAFAQEQVTDVQTVDPFTQSVSDIAKDWDHIKFEMTDKDAQLKSLEDLAKRADQLDVSYPGHAEPKIWEGIAYSTEAGIIRGMSALPKVKKAKALFESAIKIDDHALDGGAYASLGSLYYQVPGWPIAFGDNDKARQEFKNALTISADNIDTNYFYGDFLVHQDEYADAIPVLEKALQSPPRVGREVADAGRRQEIQADLDIAKSHITSKKSEHSTNN